MSKFDSRFIQTDKRLSSNSTKAVYPYLEDDSDNRWIIQYISETDSEIFNHTIQAITLSCDSHCPSLASIEAFYIQKHDANA